MDINSYAIGLIKGKNDVTKENDAPLTEQEELIEELLDALAAEEIAKKLQGETP